MFFSTFSRALILLIERSDLMGAFPQDHRSAFTIRYTSVLNSLKTDVTILSDAKSVVVSALWDTGATNSCISTDVVKSLSLTATGKLQIMTPTGSDIVNTYLVGVLLPSNVSIPDLMVCDSEIGAQGIGMLIGMDIISKGDFAVSNFQGKTVFTFRMPPAGVFDFAKDFRIKDVIGKPHGKGKRKR